MIISYQLLNRQQYHFHNCFLNGGSGNNYGNDTTSGLTVGLGYNHELAGGLAVRVEVTGTDFSDVNTNNGATNKTEIVVKDMIGARGTFSIVKSF